MKDEVRGWENMPGAAKRPTGRVREVVEVVFLRGVGIKGDPVREVTAYHDVDGTLLAENDPAVVAPHRHDWLTGNHAFQCACGVWERDPNGPPGGCACHSDKPVTF